MVIGDALSKFLSFIFVVFLSGCAGYRFVNLKNPFLRYGIKSISLPQFLNRSAIADVTAPFTDEMFNLLSDFDGLTVYAGENSLADAVLIGIVSGPSKRSKLLTVKSRVYTNSSLKAAIGKRKEFFVPSAIGYNVELQIILVRRPFKNISLLKDTDIKALKLDKSKVIFEKSFIFPSDYALSLAINSGRDSAGVTNSTLNHYRFIKSVEVLAVDAINRFKQEVINAF